MGLYQDLLTAQSATSYWALDTARADTATEPDLIGAVDLTMTGGASTAATAPPMENVTAGVSLTIAGTEGYDAGNSYDPDQDWSLSGWFKMPTQASGTNHMLFQIGDTNGTDDYVYLLRRDDQSNALLLEFGSGSGAKYLSSGIAPENDGKWHHVAVTRNYDATDTADTWTIYVDGRQAAQSTRNAIGHSANFTADSWYLGNRTALDLGMDGDLAAWAFASGTIWTADQVWMQYAHGMSNYPTSAPTPSLWLDADDAQLVVDAGGGAVSDWLDKSPNAFDADQTTAGNRPTTNATTQNSRNVLDFASDFLNMSTASDWTFLHDGTEWEAFIVAKAGNSGDPNALLPFFADNGIGAGIGAWVVFDDRSGTANEVIQMAVGTGATYALNNKSGAGYGDPNVFALVDVYADPDNGTASSRGTLWSDNKAAVQNNVSTATPSGSAAANPIQIGASGTSTFGFTGSMADILIFSPAPTATQRETLRTWLAARWAVWDVAAVGQATETDTAQAITEPQIIATVNRAAESDTAPAISSAKTKAVGQAAETDTAQAITEPPIVATANQASESDTAQTVSVAKTKAVGQATETDAARTIAPTKVGQIGQASESDTAFSMTADLSASIYPETIDAAPVIGPTIVGGTIEDEILVGTIDGSSIPKGPLYIAADASDPTAPVVTVRLFEPDGVTEIANALDTAFNVSWFDELNGPGFGRMSLPLSETAAVNELTRGRMVRCYIGGVAAFTWRIEGRPQRREIQQGEEVEQTVVVQGRGWGALLDDVIVHPAIPVLESEPDLTSPFNTRDRIFSFASPDFPNDDWPNALKMYEYSQLQPYRYQTVEVTDGDFQTFPAPVGMPYPNSPIYDGLVDPDEQKAYWIWPNNNPLQIGYAFFRGVLINPQQKPFTFSVSADNLFTLFVDGVPILGEGVDEAMWSGWKEVTVTLGTSRYYLVAAVVNNVGSYSPTNPGGFLLASYYPGADGTPEFWGMTSNHLWTAAYHPEIWPGWTPGQIMDRLMVEANDRNAVNGVFYWDFQWWSDSAGSIWDTDQFDGEYSPTVDWISFRIGSTYMAALDLLHAEGLIDWRMAGGGLVLQVFTAGSPGVTSGATYSAGVNILELEREESRPFANSLLVAYDSGLVKVEDASSVASVGRHEDTYDSEATSPEEATRLGNVELQARAVDAEGGAILMSVEPQDATDLPYVAFLPGDNVSAPSLAGGSTSMRVLSIKVDTDDLGNPSFLMELNKRWPGRERFTNDLLRTIGGKSLGTAGARGAV